MILLNASCFNKSFGYFKSDEDTRGTRIAQTLLYTTAVPELTRKPPGEQGPYTYIAILPFPVARIFGVELAHIHFRISSTDSGLKLAIYLICARSPGAWVAVSS